jgi:hypothetical protein
MNRIDPSYATMPDMVRKRLVNSVKQIIHGSMFSLSATTGLVPGISLLVCLAAMNSVAQLLLAVPLGLCWMML